MSYELLTPNDQSSSSKTGAMIGGGIGAAIIVLVLAILALCLIRRRRRRLQEYRDFISATPDPFPAFTPAPHSASPPPSGTRMMNNGPYSPSSPSVPVPTFTTPVPVMTQTAPSSGFVVTSARKKPVPFLEPFQPRSDTGSRASAASSTLTLNPVHVHPMAGADPFADPARNPFEDPVPGVPTLVVLPATPTFPNSNRSSTLSSASDLKSDSSKEVCRLPSDSLDAKPVC